MKIFSLLTIAMIMVGCSSSPYKVVETLDGKDKPSWATIEKTTWVDDGQVFAVGVAEGIDPDRVTSLMKIADNHAKTEVTRMIANQLGVDMSVVEQGLRGEGSYSFLGSEKSAVSVQELAPSSRYYEKFTLKDVEDAPVKIMFYSLVTMPEATFKKLVKEAKVGTGVAPASSEEVSPADADVP